VAGSFEGKVKPVKRKKVQSLIEEQKPKDIALKKERKKKKKKKRRGDLVQSDKKGVYDFRKV